MRARLDWLQRDTRVVSAARIAHTFGLDPPEVLAERDPLKRLVRLAAHNVVQTDAQT